MSQSTSNPPPSSAPKAKVKASKAPKTPKTPAASKVPAAKSNIAPTMLRPCAVKVDDDNFFGGQGLGMNADIATSLLALRTPDVDSYLALLIDFPLGESNEDNGFGMCHQPDSQTRRASPYNFRRIKVKFPREQIEITYRAAIEDDAAKCPKIKGAKTMSWVDIILKGSHVTVEGFAVPHANPGHSSEKWLRSPASAPVFGDKTLLDFIQQKQFTFLVDQPDATMTSRWSVDSLTPKFSYGYGTNHFWDISKYLEPFHQIKGHQFLPAWGYDNDDSHVTAVTQSQIQDVIWLYQDCLEMALERRSAYFVLKPATLGQSTRYYAVVKIGQDFWDRFNTAWARLSTDYPLQLIIHDGLNDQPEAWKARVLDYPKSIDTMSPHPLNSNDLVLEVMEPTTPRATPKNRVSLEWDLQLHEVKRKVEAVCNFLPSAAPSSLVCGQNAEDSLPGSDYEKLVMSLHRDVMRGQGFWKTMVAQADSVAQLESGMSQSSLDNQGKRMRLETLPLIDLLDGPNAEWVDALMMEALEPDRKRFRRYLSERPLGLGLITGSPGFGKTTAISLATLGMAASVGKVLASGPSHVATDNICARLDVVSHRVTDRYNNGKEQSDRQRRALVVRGFKIKHECDAFKKLLENPELGDEAAPFGTWGVRSKWKLNLSPSFWLLMCLGSSAVRPLHDDDSKALHSLRKSLTERKDVARLLDRVAQKISWEEYVNGKTLGKAELEKLMERIISDADIICTLPSLAHTEKALWNWKLKSARGIVIDEAGNMNRADLCSIWGNTMLPCLLASDERQLAPVVVTLHDQDSSDNFINRFAREGRNSALGFIQGSGWPVYRMRTQLRMAVGQFEICRTTVYSDIDCSYGPSTQVNLPSHHLGHVLEEYIQAIFPYVVPPKPDTLFPLFIDCQRSRCIVDKITHSKRNFDQIKIALDFLCDFVKAKQVNQASILIISPYSAMIESIESFRKRREYEVLRGIRPAYTIDSIQGQEGDMVIVITGTTEAVGPGFTADERRLNVMLSRHKNALLIFGDIKTVSSKGKKAMRIGSPEGEVTFCKPSMLIKVHKMLMDAGRVAKVEVK
ncbi:hypothetical protein FSARC_3064 [Fusarium sarcochroum]|uniref:DNA2/NAM7 helicase-like C-terminal domain-containing protein n=1 Tax=Fusarium sarcochroum TaxID=1208366 RepID=A0A8H4U4X3_9HYPO|nr:hypothetical protein FSARC_3064 [Fusarium sarcochroum]